MDTVLGGSAHLCTAEAGDATAPLGVDSNGVETARYAYFEGEAPDFTPTRVKTYIKYHIVALLGL